MSKTTVERIERVTFSAPGDSVSWSGNAEYLDYTELRSWLRHPVGTWRWWRHPEAPRNGGMV